MLRPGGLVGISFWGQGPPLDIREVFKVFAFHAPERHRGSMRRLNDIAVPGVAEEMLESSGFSVLERGGRVSTMEWPDAETAWRAISSVGPAVPRCARTTRRCCGTLCLPRSSRVEMNVACTGREAITSSS